MREILFRGKCVDAYAAGEWAYGFYTNEEYNEVYETPCSEVKDHYIENQDDTMRVDPETIGQYTGLKDKNGKRIFEGDVFRFPDEVWKSYYTSCGTEYNSWEVENYGVVGFCEESAKYDFVKYKYNENSVEADLHENGTLDFVEFLAELEVIGTIHDNPELLEEA